MVYIRTHFLGRPRLTSFYNTIPHMCHFNFVFRSVIRLYFHFMAVCSVGLNSGQFHGFLISLGTTLRFYHFAMQKLTLKSHFCFIEVMVSGFSTTFCLIITLYIENYKFYCNDKSKMPNQGREDFSQLIHPTNEINLV